MNYLVGRTLALLCGLVVALPSHWCCLLGPVACCAHEKPARPSCCGQKVGAARSCCPTPPAGPRTTPRLTCCDERHFTTSDTRSTFLDSAAALGPTVPLSVPLTGRGAQALSLVTPDESPPLHLLHCVWLC